MGVYIKGAKMPRTCFECDLYDDENNFCKAQKEYLPFALFGRDNKDANCPMVEVPEPHGRLIDEDNVIDAIHERLHTLQTHKEFIKKRGDLDLLGVLFYISRIQAEIEAEDEG